jgi:hypothetical protein
MICYNLHNYNPANNGIKLYLFHKLSLCLVPVSNAAVTNPLPDVEKPINNLIGFSTYKTNVVINTLH